MSKRIPVVIVALTSLLGACNQEPEVSESEAPLYVATSTIWKGGFIPVCWESGSTDPVKRAWVRDAVEQIWSQNAAVTFEGWGICTSGARGIRIHVADQRNHVDRLGNALDGEPNGMTLNFTYQSYNPACSKSAAELEACIRVQSGHEFGHALGFSHEQNRPDTPQYCLDEPDHGRQGANGNLVIGPWDADSIMNYCNYRYNHARWPYRLSAGDIRGVQAVYGRRANHSFVGHGGHCLDVVGGVATPGAYLQTWDCNNGAGQSWVPPFRGGPFASQLGDCVWGFTGYPTMKTCAGAPEWYFSAVQIRGFGGKCLALDDPNGTTVGSGLHLQTCNTAFSQRFVISYQEIHAWVGGLCLRGDLGAGSPLRLSYCNDNREWTMQLGTFARQDGTCLSIGSASTEDGTPVTVERCSSALQEQFNMTGQLTSNLGTCLEIATDTTVPVTPVDIADCRSGIAGENQQWDYYW